MILKPLFNHNPLQNDILLTVALKIYSLVQAFCSMLMMQSNRQTLSETSEVSVNTLIAYSLGVVTNIYYAHTNRKSSVFFGTTKCPACASGVASS